MERMLTLLRTTQYYYLSELGFLSMRNAEIATAGV